MWTVRICSPCPGTFAPIARETLAGADVVRRVGPPPVVDVELRRDERLGHRVWIDARLLPVPRNLLAVDVAASVLAADDVLGAGRVHRLQHLHLLIPDRV